MKIFTALMLIFSVLYSLDAAASMETEQTAAPVVLKAYVPTRPESVPTKALMQFADRINTASNGRLIIQVYDSGQYGNDREAIDAVRMGIIDILFAGTGGFSELHRPLRMLDLPFVFSNSRDAQRVIESGECFSLFEGFEAHGLKYLATGDNGMRHVSTATVPVYSVDDVKDLKIRVPEIDTYVDIWNHWGSQVVPMPITELYDALERSQVDAQDNAPYHSLASGVYMVQKYYSFINYMWMGLSMVINIKSWEGLDTYLQELVESEARAVAAWTFDEIEHDNAAALAVMRESGILIIETPDRDSFKKGIEQFYSRYEDQPWFDRSVLDCLRTAGL